MFTSPIDFTSSREIEKEEESKKGDKETKLFRKPMLGKIAGILGSLVIGGLGVMESGKVIINRQSEITNTYELYTAQFEDPLLNKSREEIEKARFNIIYGQDDNLSLEKALKESQEKAKKIAVHIRILLNYYRQVDECVEHKICDRKTVDVLFSRSIRNFNATFAPYLCTQGREDKKWIDNNRFSTGSSNCSFWTDKSPKTIRTSDRPNGGFTFNCAYLLKNESHPGAI